MFVRRGMEYDLGMVFLEKMADSVAVADIGNAKNLGSPILMLSQFQLQIKNTSFALI